LNWRFWRSPRDRAIGDMRKELHHMSHTIDTEYEDAELMELMDEMESLRRTFQRLLEPETPSAAGPTQAPVIPPEALEAALEFVPEGWRGIAGLMARRMLNDPAQMKKITDKLGPYLQKLQGQQSVTPQQQQQGTPMLPLELSGRSYDPNRPGQ